MPVFVFDVISPSDGNGITTSQAVVAIARSRKAAMALVKDEYPKDCKIRCEAEYPRRGPVVFAVGYNTIISP